MVLVYFLLVPSIVTFVRSQTYNINRNYQQSISQLLEIRINDFDVFTKVMNHGCWCAQIGKTNSLGGAALDDLDRACKKWIEMRKCKGN